MVSVLIPSYNNATWLEECIQSCFDQGELLHEIIVVDDHSTDNSWDTLNAIQDKYPGKVKIFLNPEKGANSARNFAFSKSSGNYIQWLDSDDYILEGKFEAQVAVLENSDADIVYSDFRLDTYDGVKFEKAENKTFDSYIDYLEELLEDNWNASHSYLLKRSLAQKLDGGVGWNSSTKVGQDREYFTMAGILGAKFTYVKGCFAVYNKRKTGTISGMDFKQRLELNQVLENRFRLEIGKCVDVNKRKEYLKILDTHLIKACFYHDKIKVNRFISPLSIKWSIVHWKMRLAIPFVWLRVHMLWALGKK